MYPYHGVIIDSNKKSKLKIGPQPFGHSLHGTLESKRQNSFQSHATNTNGLRAPLAVGFDYFRILIHRISSCDCNYVASVAPKTFKCVCIKFVRKVEGELVWYPLQGYHISVIIKQFQPPNKGVCNRLHVAVSRWVNPIKYCSCHRYLNIHHMVYCPISQRQVSWAYNLHCIWNLSIYPCPRCLLLAILRVLDKPKLVARYNPSHHGSLLVSMTTVAFANTRHTRICWLFRRPLCGGYVMAYQFEIACHQGNSPSGHGGPSN